MAKVKQESIASIGLEKYLDDRRSLQNGFGYKEFQFFMSPEIRMPISVARRIYKVNRKTISKWKALLPGSEK